MHNKNEIILSICIASYNHGQELFEKVLNILSYKGEDIEIVISDNCSNDNTVELLGVVKDKRLVFIQNNVNKGPVVNYIKALSNGKGRYVMFLTDKDTLDISSLKNIIDILRVNTFSLGYFSLDFSCKRKICMKRFIGANRCFYEFAYLSKHPTGYFYNNKLLKDIRIEQKFVDIDKVGYFPFEFICAELALNGNGIIWNIPFCNTSKIPKDGTKYSGTYSAVNNNLFFSPQNRFDQYERYIIHLGQLKIPSILRLRTMLKLTKSTYYMMTKGFSKIMGDKDKCLYYKVDKDKINLKGYNELVSYFYSRLINSNVFNNVFEKYLFIFQSRISFRKKHL